MDHEAGPAAWETGSALPSRLMTPSLYAANSLMESLKSNMKAELITPLVSSLGLA